MLVDQMPSPNPHRCVLVRNRLAEEMEVRGVRGTLLGSITVVTDGDPDTGRIRPVSSLLKFLSEVKPCLE